MDVPRCVYVNLHQRSVSWETEDFLWVHEWVSETSVTWKENDIFKTLKWDIDVPCPLQLTSATNLNHKFVNIGTTFAKFRDTASSAIELTCNIIFDRSHTPRACFSRAVSFFFCHAHDKDWTLEEEVQGRGVGKNMFATFSDSRGRAGRARTDA